MLLRNKHLPSPHFVARVIRTWVAGKDKGSWWMIGGKAMLEKDSQHSLSSTLTGTNGTSFQKLIRRKTVLYEELILNLSIYVVQWRGPSC